MEFLGDLWVCGLFALHAEDDDLVGEGDFFEVGFFIGLSFSQFDTLGEEVVSHGILDFGSVLILVNNPAGELVGIFPGIFGKLRDLHHCLGDGLLMSVQIFEHGVIRVNTTGDLTVGIYLRSSRQGEENGGECECKFDFHNTRSLSSDEYMRT